MSLPGPSGLGEAFPPVENPSTSQGVPLILMKGGSPEIKSGTSVKNASPAVPVSTGHRSRKEKLVLRSFSTEMDEMDFSEPKLISSKTSLKNDRKRASRNRRTASAPDPSRKSSSTDSAKSSPKHENSPDSEDDETEDSYAGQFSGGGSKNEDNNMMMAGSESHDIDLIDIATPSPPSKQKNRTSLSPKIKVPLSLERKMFKKQISYQGKKSSCTFDESSSSSSSTSSPDLERVMVERRNKLVRTYVKKKVSVGDVNNKAPVKRKLEWPSPGKKDQSRLDSRGSKELNKPLKSILKNPLYKASYKSTYTPSILSSPEKPCPLVLKSEVLPLSPRKQVMWSLKSNFTKVIQKYLNEDPDFDVANVSSQLLSTQSSSESFGSQSGAQSGVDSSKTSPKKPKMVIEEDKEGEHRKTERQQQDLLHYVVGVACMEQLLDPNHGAKLPQLFYEMIDNLSTVFTNGKENLSHLMEYARNLVVEKRREEIQLLLRDKKNGAAEDKRIGEDTSLSDFLMNEFRPVFPLGTVLDDTPSVSYPRVSEDELSAYETLVGSLHEIQVGDDDYQFAHLFINLLESEFTILAKKSKIHKLGFNGMDESFRKVSAKLIPVNRYEDAQNSHGLFINLDNFSEILNKFKKERLTDLEKKVLRNGKELSRESLENIPGIKKTYKRSRRKNKKFAQSIPATQMPESFKEESPSEQTPHMRLRTGKELVYTEILTTSLLNPTLKLNIGASDDDNYESPNDEPIEAISIPEMNEDFLFTDLGCVLEKPKDLGRCVTARGRFPSVPLSQPLCHWSPPMSPHCAASSSSHSEYPQYKPTLPSRLVQSGSTSGLFGDTLESTKTAKKPYSRHRHAKICPPFDNNHCSFSGHFCGHPRAAGSRFCTNHVDEGATIYFDRCKYVKGSRECGRFIPKSQSQTVFCRFCDMHSRAIAFARSKKSKLPKSGDVTPLLLKHMRCNLDRVQGKLMELDEHGQYRVREALWEDEREALNDSSDSDEDEGCSLGEYIKHQGLEDSDFDEDIPIENEGIDYNLLKRAGYFSVSEVANIYRSKLSSLQKIYQRQFLLLKRQYKRGRKEFLREVRDLKERKLNFTTDPKFISFEQREEINESYLEHEVKSRMKTMAYLKHKRNSGPRSVCQLQVLKARQKMIEEGRVPSADPDEPSSYLIERDELDIKFDNRRVKRPKHTTCNAVNPGGDKCIDRPIPLARYCHKHISLDKNQKLFTTCGFPFGPDADDVCKVTTFSELEKFGCQLHRLPIPSKEPVPDKDEQKLDEDEEEFEKMMKEIGSDDGDSSDSSSSSDTEGSDSSDADLIEEMEHLVGDEVVDMDHFKEALGYLTKKGIMVSDTEESDDTDEEEQNECQPGDDFFVQI